MSTIGFLINPTKVGEHSQGPALVTQAIEGLTSRGQQVLVNEEAAPLVAGAGQPSTESDLEERADLLIVLGGGGAILHGTRLAAGRTPVLGGRGVGGRSAGQAPGRCRTRRDAASAVSRPQRRRRHQERRGPRPPADRLGQRRAPGQLPRRRAGGLDADPFARPPALRGGGGWAAPGGGRGWPVVARASLAQVHLPVYKQVVNEPHRGGGPQGRDERVGRRETRVGRGRRA